MKAVVVKAEALASAGGRGGSACGPDSATGAGATGQGHSQLPTTASAAVFSSGEAVPLPALSLPLRSSPPLPSPPSPPPLQMPWHNRRACKSSMRRINPHHKLASSRSSTSREPCGADGGVAVAANASGAGGSVVCALLVEAGTVSAALLEQSPDTPAATFVGGASSRKCGVRMSTPHDVVVVERAAVLLTPATPCCAVATNGVHATSRRRCIGFEMNGGTTLRACLSRERRANEDTRQQQQQKRRHVGNTKQKS